MGAVREGHSIFEPGVQGLDSKVKLTDDGADKSLEQYRTGGLANVDAAEREAAMVRQIDFILEQIAKTQSIDGTELDQLARKLVNEQSPKEVLKESIRLAKQKIDVLGRINPDLAEELYEDLAMTISNNENIAPWAEELLSSDQERQ